MPNKNHRKAPPEAASGQISRGQVQFAPDTLRESDYSVEFVLASESPARVFDPSLYRIVTECLMASGMEIPPGGTMPLQDSHRRESVDDNLGSVREIRRQGDLIIGRLYFDADDPKGLKAFNKVKNRHIDSGSITYRQGEAIWIERGESVVHEGKKFEGPMVLTKTWTPSDFSLLAVGADSNAKARSEDNTEILSREAVAETIIKEIPEMENKTTEQPQTVDVEAITRAAVEAEKQRAAGITSLCKKHGMDNMIVTSIESGKTLDQVRAEILDEMARASKPVADVSAPAITMGETEHEKFRAAATDGMLMRGGLQVAAPANGATQVRAMGFEGIAREALRLAGIDTRYMDKQELLKRALSTSDFPNVLANTANKAVQIGYQAARSTWRAWAKAGVLNDFKTASRVKLDDAPDMLATLEGAEIQHGVIGDTGESIALTTYARKLVITRQALINDDLGLFNSIFRAFGFRAANLIEATAYGILTNGAVATMSDGGAVFNSTAVTTAGGHANLASSAAVVSSTSIDVAELAMMSQVAPNGTKLDIMPKFLIVGPKNKVAASILCNSMGLPTATYSSAVVNPYSDLTPVVSAHMGQKWVLCADPMQIDTVEVAFLNGVETPTLYQKDNDDDILGRSYIGFIDIAAKAIEWRSMFYNAGA